MPYYARTILVTGPPDEVETANLAFGATTRASAALGDQPPEFAVDEDDTTQWGAGASPTQCIEVDLNLLGNELAFQPFNVLEIR